MLGQDEFHALFVAGFNVAHGVTGFQSLAVAEGDTRAKAAADALYDTIIDIPALHFILQPTGKWLPRIVAIGAFAIPMARGVAQEMQQSQPTKPAAAPSKPASAAQPASRPRQEGDPAADDHLATLRGVRGNA